MNFLSLCTRKNGILLCIIFTALLGLYLRYLPESLLSSSVPKLIETDPWYNLRQIELLITHFPHYSWFDPMTAYPNGKMIDWGPVTPFLYAIVCMVAGADVQYEILTTASLFTPILSLAMIPVMWYGGNLLFSKKAGIFAAILIPVMSGEFMYFSFYGIVDHHLLEAILGTLFAFCFCRAIYESCSTPDPGRYRLILISTLAGFFYFLCILTTPIMVLFALIVVIYVYIMAVVSHPDEMELRNGVIIILLSFGTFILLYLLFGIQNTGFLLIQYSVSHVLVAALLMALSVSLYVVSFLLKHVSRLGYGLTTILLGSGIFGCCYLLQPDIVSHFFEAFHDFFLLSADTTYITEMKMLTIERLWSDFNLCIPLMIIGLYLIGKKAWQSKDPPSLFILVWSAVLLLVMVLHQKYEYYGVAVVVVLTAGTLAFLYENPVSIPGQIKNLCIRLKERLYVDSLFHTADPVSPSGYPGNLQKSAVILVTCIIIILSVCNTISFINHDIPVISDDWVDSLFFLEKYTPSTGVDYYQMYNREEFQYPPESYGILTFWRAGHWITFIAHRIPVTNPFQDNLKGSAKASSYFLQTNETQAENIADALGAQYIITDENMLLGYFPSMVIWADDTHTQHDFIIDDLKTNQSTTKQKSVFFTQTYYETMVSRLHLFDGSEQTGLYSFYQEKPLEYQTVIQEIKNQRLSQVMTQPLLTIPSLHNYRLVYESQTPGFLKAEKDVRMVKIFERVDGIVIKGNGTIEVPIRTNQGREFVYRQHSSNGEFILPYSTKHNPYGVIATGPYTIVETNETIEVDENDLKALH